VTAEDKLFSTLDPVTRKVRLDSGREVLFTDTVGFIQKLPPAIVAAFRATLEEIREARIIVHVADVSNPNLANHIDEVEKILHDLEIGGKPTILALNKTDLLPGSGDSRNGDPLPEFLNAEEPPPGVVFISATEQLGLKEILGEVERLLGVEDSAEAVVATA
jgi:GTP-binding protein HflX